ncbi:MAG: hypothetical protein J7M34_08415, partial [Anaerolineae bacterium]|nr:hypothetical protein [Anaerolineae bacterium]
HRTTVLWLPGLLVWLWPDRHKLDRRLVGGVLAGLLLPLTLYLYIPLRAPATPYLWVPLGPGETLALYENSLSGFLGFVMGKAFTGELLSPPAAWAQLPAAFDLIWRNAGGPGVLLAGIGIIWLIWRRRWRLLALTGLIFIAQVGFNLFYGIGDVYVLYVPVYLIMALWSAIGLAALASIVPRRSHRLVNAIPLIGLSLPVFLVITFLPLVDRSSDHKARRFWDNVLSQSLPQRAVLVSNDRDEIAPLIYIQQVEGQRTDLTGLFPLIVQQPGWLNVGQVTQRALDTGRPVFLDKPMPGLDVRFDMQPMGAIVRVTGSVQRLPGKPLGAVGDALTLLAVDVDPADLQPGRPVTVTLYWQPKRPLSKNYTSFVHLLDGHGEKIGQHDAPPGGVYYPTSLWQPGEVLRDRHPIALPDSLPTGPYSLRIGFYFGPDVTPLGKPLKLPWNIITHSSH